MRVAIVGAGISGLAAAYYLKKTRPDWEVRLFEKEQEAGGKLRSSQRDGFIFDWGPNGFLSNAEDCLDLAKDLGLGPSLRPASGSAKYRFLYKDARLQALPTSPQKMLLSSLLTPFAKTRAALEYVLGKASAKEETVYDFIRRHFGKAVAEVFAEPLVLGISAGNAQELSLDALFPRLRKLEREQGSLIKAMIAQQKTAQLRLNSFSGGMQTLTSALSKSVQASLCKQEVKALAKELKGYRLEFREASPEVFDKVLLATPAFVSARLLKDILPETSAALLSIPYVDVVVVGLAYDRLDVPQILDAFGFLVARAEALRSLGVLYSSSVFPDQAPKEKVMLRLICGGSPDPEFIRLSHSEILKTLRHDLEVALGITAQPEFVQVIRWPQAIAQYTLGHLEKVKAIMAAVAQQGGLHLLGSAFYGLGLNDCVRDAKRVLSELEL